MARIVARKADIGKRMKVSKPHCPEHKKDMMYNAELALWQCAEPGCHQTALPKRGADGEPVIAEGPAELMIVKTKDKSKFLLRGRGNNVVHDITPLVREVTTGREDDLSPWDRSLDATTVGNSDSAYVELTLRVPLALVLNETD